jgi:putative FmdB family regulatory protein
MPIYEYQCAACGQIVEKWQKFSEAPLTVCPQCGGSLAKLISACAFHLKGSGWYVSDHAGKSQGTEPSGNGKETEPAKEGAEVSSSTQKAQEAKAGEKSESSPPPKFT